MLFNIKVLISFHLYKNQLKQILTKIPIFCRLNGLMPHIFSSFALQRKAELDEFAALYVPNCGFSIVACSNYNGAQCVRSHFISWKAT